MSGQHVVVVGGGIIGLSSAYHLLRRGARVTLVERDGFDNSASTGNAGFIVLGHPPLPRPGLTRQALRMLLDPANPLYVPPRFDPALFRWLWRFRAACNERQFHHAMDVLARLGHVAGEAFDWIVAEEALDCAYHRDGWLEVFQTQPRLDQARHEVEILQRYGYRFDEIPGERLRDEEPAFRDNVLAAIRYNDSGAADPGRCVAQLAQRLAQRGATVRTGVAVKRIVIERGAARGVELDDGQRLDAEHVVLAAGIWSRDLARDIGVSVPMQPAKGYHVNMTMPQPAVSTSCLLAEAFVAVNPTCNGLRLAGTLEFSGINHRIMQRRLDMLATNARRFLHGLDDCQITSTWCGLRPCTADGLPVIGWAPRIERLFLATGHAMLGFGLGPGTGRLVAEAICGESTSVDLTPLSPARHAR